MKWKAAHVFVSHAKSGDAVDLEPLSEGLWRVWFHFYEAGIFAESDFRLRRPTLPRPPTSHDQNLPKAKYCLLCARYKLSTMSRY